MSDDQPIPPEITDDLLADRALGALSADDAIELRRRLAGRVGDAESLDRAAALVAAGGPASVGPMPAGLTDKLRSDAQAFVRPATPRRTSGPWWIAASVAAVMTVAALVGWHMRPRSADLVADRQAFVHDQGDAVVVSWTPTADPNARTAWGDVVWSPARQRGYMQFVGLTPNRADEQYQLWIFDADRDERYPVDGGLFDVPAQPGRTIVPITPRVAVGRATLFAVTLERRGGVVVSKRDRLPLLATVPKPAARPA